MKGPVKALAYIVLILPLLVALFPFYWGTVTSFKPFNQIFANPPIFFPQPVVFDAYELLFSTVAPISLLNSFYIAATTGIITLVITMLGAYALARFPFLKGRNVIFGYLLAAPLFPAMIYVISLYRLLLGVGLINTHMGMIVVYTAYSIPFSLWILYGYFQTLPVELEEAAYLDGCGILSVLRRIVVPLSMPAMVAAFVFSFIVAYGDFVYANGFLQTTSLQTMSVWIAHQGGGGQILSKPVQWAATLGGGVIYTIPAAILFVFLQRFLVSGLTAGALKE